MTYFELGDHPFFSEDLDSPGRVILWPVHTFQVFLVRDYKTPGSTEIAFVERCFDSEEEADWFRIGFKDDKMPSIAFPIDGDITLDVYQVTRKHIGVFD